MNVPKNGLVFVFKGVQGGVDIAAVGKPRGNWVDCQMVSRHPPIGPRKIGRKIQVVDEDWRSVETHRLEPLQLISEGVGKQRTAMKFVVTVDASGKLWRGRASGVSRSSCKAGPGATCQLSEHESDEGSHR